jgi:hypothetical protein
MFKENCGAKKGLAFSASKTTANWVYLELETVHHHEVSATISGAVVGLHNAPPSSVYPQDFVV